MPDMPVKAVENRKKRNMGEKDRGRERQKEEERGTQKEKDID